MVYASDSSEFPKEAIVETINAMNAEEPEQIYYEDDGTRVEVYEVETESYGTIESVYKSRITSALDFLPTIDTKATTYPWSTHTRTLKPGSIYSFEFVFNRRDYGMALGGEMIFGGKIKCFQGVKSKYLTKSKLYVDCDPPTAYTLVSEDTVCSGNRTSEIKLTGIATLETIKLGRIKYKIETDFSISSNSVLTYKWRFVETF